MRTTRYPLSAAGPGLMGGLTRGTYLITFLQISVPELSIKFWNPEQEVASGFRCVSTAAIAGLRRSLLGVIFFLLLLSPPLHPSLPRWRSSAGFIHVPGRVYSLIMYLILWAWLICINSSAPSISVFSYSFPRVFRSFLRGSLSIESLHSRQRTTAPCWRPFCFTRPVPRGAPHFASSGDVSTLAPRGPRPERPWGVNTGHCSPCMSRPCQVALQGGRPGFYPHLCPPQPAGGFLACRVQALFKWNRGLDELTHSVVLLSPACSKCLCRNHDIALHLKPNLRRALPSAQAQGCLRRGTGSHWVREKPLVFPHLFLFQTAPILAIPLVSHVPPAPRQLSDLDCFIEWRLIHLYNAWKWKLLSRVRLCDPMGYAVHEILQARILE